MPTFTLMSADEGNRSSFISDDDKTSLMNDLKTKYSGNGFTIDSAMFQGDEMVVNYKGTIPTTISKSSAVNPIFLNTSEGLDARTFQYQFKGTGGRKSRRRRNMRKKRTMKRKGSRK